jgi:hypothetical protein
MLLKKQKQKTKSEYPSDPVPMQFENTTNRSWWIIQTQPTQASLFSHQIHQPQLVDSFIFSL